MRYWAFIILIIAFAARFAMLSSNPAGVFHDEAEKGYSAYSLFRIGGVLDFTQFQKVTPHAHIPVFHSWPLYVNVWGSLTSMVYQYSALLFVAVGGLNEWTTRLPAACIASLTVLLAFFLAKRITGSREIALIGLLFLAFSPWHLIFSRWAQQGIFVPFFIVAGLLFLLDSDSITWKASRMLGSAACFGLAFYAYSGAQPFLLLFFPMLLLIYGREFIKSWKASVPAGVLLLLLMAPTLNVTFGGGGVGMGRMTAVGVFNMDASLAAKIALFLKNYLTHFSPQFLFISGDALDRHSLRGFGEMLYIEAITLPAGLYIIAKRRTKHDLLLLGWFLLFPVSAALTREGIPHALRTLHAIPCPQIISAIGAWHLIQWARTRSWGRMAIPASVSFVCINVIAILVTLFFYYPHYSAPSFEYGIREATTKPHASNPDVPMQLRISPDSGIPMVPELLYFHSRCSPKMLLSEGIESSPVQFLNHPVGPQEASEMLNAGTGLLVGANYDTSGVAGIAKIEPIRWYPKPFESEGLTIYLLLSKATE